MAILEDDWSYELLMMEDGSTPRESPFYNRKVSMEQRYEEIDFFDYTCIQPHRRNPEILLDGCPIPFERFKELVNEHNEAVRKASMDKKLKDKLFEFKDFVSWFHKEGYDVTEIGADSFAVTANNSRFDSGKTYHVTPGGVMEYVER